MNNINYKLARGLKEAGFPQGNKGYYFALNGKYEYGFPPLKGFDERSGVHIPTLSELIDACGDKLVDLTRVGKNASKKSVGNYPEGTKWMTNNISFPRSYGETPEEAVAELWLLLKLNE